MTTTNPDSTAPETGFRFHPRLWAGAAMVLVFPALGMVMSDAVNWGAEDFAMMALLLGLLCTAIEAALHRRQSPRWRVGGIMIAVLMFVTVWAHLAVGLWD